MRAALLGAWADYECPNGCGASEQIRPLRPGESRMHPCPRVHGLLAPLQPAGADCRDTPVERQDYTAGAQPAWGDDSRPYAAVLTRWGDGSQGAAVLVPPATAGARS